MLYNMKSAKLMPIIDTVWNFLWKRSPDTRDTVSMLRYWPKVVRPDRVTRSWLSWPLPWYAVHLPAFHLQSSDRTSSKLNILQDHLKGKISKLETNIERGTVTDSFVLLVGCCKHLLFSIHYHSLWLIISK